MPVMAAVMVFAARWTIRHFSVSPRPAGRLGMGFLALGLLLAAEFSLVLKLRGLSIHEYLAARDPVSGTAYYVSLVLFAVMPLLVERR
jgi:hypothetical protein